METHVKMRGDSLVLSIPKLLAIEAGLEAEATVELKIEDGKLVVERVAQPERNLDQLLEQVTKDNLHGEVHTGPAVGGEVW